jgi:hypothetical protein
MSWDGIIMKFPKGVPIEDLPDDWKGPSLGNSNDIEKLIKDNLPWTKNEAGYSVIESDDSWVEITYEPEGDIQSISIRTNAAPVAMDMLKKLCGLLDASLFDNQIGEIADFDKMTVDSMRDYSEWRDRVMKDYKDNT